MKKLITIIATLFTLSGYSQQYFMLPDSLVEFQAISVKNKKADTLLLCSSDIKAKITKYKELEKTKTKQDTVRLQGNMWYIPLEFTGNYIEGVLDSGYMSTKSNGIIWDGNEGVILTNQNGELFTKQEFEGYWNEYDAKCIMNNQTPSMQIFINSFLKRKTKNK